MLPCHLYLENQARVWGAMLSCHLIVQSSADPLSCFPPTQMLLLDRAIKMAAELDEPEEMNFVRKHARQQAEELGLKNLRDAAVRVFSNSSGEGAAWGELGTVHQHRQVRKSSQIHPVNGRVLYALLIFLLTPPSPPLRLLLFQREPGC